MNKKNIFINKLDTQFIYVCSVLKINQITKIKH